MTLPYQTKDLWQRLSLTQQFALAALTVVVPGAIAVGWWIPDRINDAVINNAAAGTVLYMDGLLGPFIPELSARQDLSMQSRVELDRLLKNARDDGKIVSIKVWRLDGTILYSSFAELIGKRFEPTDTFEQARNGGLGVSYDEAGRDEDAQEQKIGIPLLEVYTPVRDPATRQVIAISEFYADGSSLGRDITNATRLSWFIIGLAAAALLGALSFIVSKASELITAQRVKLEYQVDELQGLLAQNQSLRNSLRLANENVAQINERVLQRVGADLHDGPAQMLAYAMLRMTPLKKLAADRPGGASAVQEMNKILSDALRDIRHLSTGLMMPELSKLSLAGAAKLAADLHSEYTDTSVDVRISLNREFNNEALKTCVYRFVQEGLSNAFKHAGGKGQYVELSWSNGIVVRIVDAGGGMEHIADGKTRLGLAGMRSRIEAIGGTLDIAPAGSSGTQLTAYFPETIDWS
jgi:signal transduction histidine kinase